MNRKLLTLIVISVAAAACNKQAATLPTIQTATAQRRDIIVQAEATGVIEPIEIVEVKSKTASGQVIDESIEIGANIKVGDLIVQIDTTDLHTTLLQNLSDREAAKSTYDVAKQVLDRNNALYAQHVITKDVLESAENTEANAKASLLKAETSVTLQLQKLKDSKVVAAASGTILTRPVTKGQVVQAGSGGVSAGTVIATMADLSRVRARALVAETEIGNVQVGQDATVLVDAFPDRAFNGTVQKIEPQAVVQQNVTMFPVLISLQNEEGLLRPGMNGEVNVRTNERTQVITIPNDAIRSTREWEQSARALGLNPDSVRAVAMPGRGGNGGGRGGNGGNGGGANGGGGGGQKSGGRGGLADAGTNALGLAAVTSAAELDPSLQGGGNAGGQAGQGGGRRGGGRGPQVEVTDADCKAIDAAMKKHPDVQKKLDDMRAAGRGGDSTARAKMQADREALYKSAGVDGQKLGACRFRNGGGRNGGANGQQFGGGAGGAGGAGGFGGAGGGRGNRQGGGPGGARRPVDPNATPRTGLVFVQKGASWEPRVLRLGVANYDFTEVTSGIDEGDKVAMMSAAILQLRRQDQADRTKAAANPLGGGGAGPGGGGPGGGRGGPGGGGGRGN